MSVDAWQGSAATLLSDGSIFFVHVAAGIVAKINGLLLCKPHWAECVHPFPLASEMIPLVDLPLASVLYLVSRHIEVVLLADFQLAAISKCDRLAVVAVYPLPFVHCLFTFPYSYAGIICITA